MTGSVPSQPTGTAAAVVARLAEEVQPSGAAFMWSVAASQPSLGNRVANVVELSAKEQMLRPDARAVIAGVANVQALGDWSVGRLPREARRLDDTAIGRYETAVALTRGTGPLPAVARCVHLRPEPLSFGASDHGYILPILVNLVIRMAVP